MNLKKLSLGLMLSFPFSVFAAPMSKYSETFMKACGKPQAQQMQIYKDELLGKGELINSIRKSISKNSKLAVTVITDISSDLEIQSLRDQVDQLKSKYENEMDPDFTRIFKEKHDNLKSHLHTRINDHLKQLDIDLTSRRINIVGVSMDQLNLNADGLFIKMEIKKNQVVVTPEAYKTYYDEYYTYDQSKDKKAILDNFYHSSELVLEDLVNKPLSLQKAIDSWVTSGLTNSVIFNGEVYSIYEYKLKEAINANPDLMDQIQLCSGESTAEKLAKKMQLISQETAE